MLDGRGGTVLYVRSTPYGIPAPAPRRVRLDSFRLFSANLYNVSHQPGFVGGFCKADWVLLRWRRLPMACQHRRRCTQFALRSRRSHCAECTRCSTRLSAIICPPVVLHLTVQGYPGVICPLESHTLAILCRWGQSLKMRAARARPFDLRRIR